MPAHDTSLEGGVFYYPDSFSFQNPHSYFCIQYSYFSQSSSVLMPL